MAKPKKNVSKKVPVKIKDQKDSTKKTKTRSNQSRLVVTKSNMENQIKKGKVKILKGEVVNPGGAAKKIIFGTANQVSKVRKHGPGRKEYERMKKKLGIDTNKGAEINILGQWKKLGN